MNVKELLVVLFASKGYNLEEKTSIMAIWEKFIKQDNISINQLENAVNILAKTKTKYGIQYADIYEIVNPKKDTEIEALKFWNTIRKKIKNQYPFNETERNYLEKFIDISSLADMKARDLQFLQKDFIKVYKNENKNNKELKCIQE